jgi:hypothetical protein
MSNRPMQALVIHPHGTAASGVRSISTSLTNLQKIVGGYLEPVYGYRAADGSLRNWPTATLYVNELGKIHGAPENLVATALWWALDPQAAGRNLLAGTVVVLGPGEEDGGGESPVPEHVMAMFTALCDGEDIAYSQFADH